MSRVRRKLTKRQPLEDGESQVSTPTQMIAPLDDGSVMLAMIQTLIPFGPRTDERWVVRRFYVRDPFGDLVTILAHI